MKHPKTAAAIATPIVSSFEIAAMTYMNISDTNKTANINIKIMPKLFKPVMNTIIRQTTRDTIATPGTMPEKQFCNTSSSTTYNIYFDLKAQNSKKI